MKIIVDLYVMDNLIGQNIKNMRLDSGMTQKTLASSIGVSYQQLQKYETAKNRVSASRLFLIANSLEKPICCFYRFSNKNSLSE